MEQEQVRRGSLKIRILRNLFVVLAVSMLLSTIISYVYFERIVREQKIEEEGARLQQVSNQLYFMVEDVQNFARNIIVDADIQDIVENMENETEFDEIRKRDTVAKRLIFYNSLRTYIRNSFLELENGEFYSSSSNNLQKDYVDQKLSIDGIREYRQHAEWFFSNPYNGIDNWDYKPMICYSTRMMDIHYFGRQKAVLTLEINLEYFLKQVQDYGREYSNVCLVGNDGLVLYEEDESRPISRLLKNQDQYLVPGTYRVNGGYLICKDIEGIGWKLCTLVTTQYLRDSCSFVPKFFFLSFLISIMAILLTASKLMEGITKPITYLSKQMEHTDYEKLHAQETVQTGDEIQTLYECYNAMVGEIQRGIEQKMEYEKQKRNMEFDIMLSQINPHYLYNVLNTVVYLSASGKNKEVVNIVNSLIYTLQETINLGDKNIETTVQRELELTECYLEIQKYRYPKAFSTLMACADAERDCIVPKTIIQPIVENAILHGILPSEKNGTIAVTVSRQREVLCVVITDDGVGISEERLQQFRSGETIIYEENGRKHIGISNVRDRILYLYGEPYGMWIENRAAGGTKVELHLPYIKKRQNI